MEALIFLVVIGILVAITVMLLPRKRRRRIRDIRAWAHRNGWTYTRRGDHLKGYYSGTPFTSRGKYRNVLAGQRRGVSVLVFEYRYTTVGVEGFERHYFQVVVARVPPSPWLEATREHVGHALLSLPGVHDLRLGDEGFDRTFRIRTDDDGFATRVLRPEMTRWMMGDARAQENPFRFAGENMVTWKHKKIDPADALERVDYLIDLYDRVPQHAWGVVSSA